MTPPAPEAKSSSAAVPARARSTSSFTPPARALCTSAALSALSTTGQPSVSPISATCPTLRASCQSAVSTPASSTSERLSAAEGVPSRRCHGPGVGSLRGTAEFRGPANRVTAATALQAESRSGSTISPASISGRTFAGSRSRQARTVGTAAPATAPIERAWSSLPTTRIASTSPLLRSSSHTFPSRTSSPTV